LKVRAKPSGLMAIIPNMKPTAKTDWELRPANPTALNIVN
jgi:hypothetical protein